MKRVQGDCPLGSKCEEVETRNGEQVLVTCPWYTKIQGVDPQGNDVDEWKCAMAWMPMLQVESSQTNRGVSSAIESFRNVHVDTTVATIEALGHINTPNKLKIIGNT